MVINLFASMLFYLIPFITGRIFTKNIFLAWVYGALFWFASFFLVYYFLLFTHLLPFIVLMRFLIMGVLAIGSIRIVYDLPSFRFRRELATILGLVTLAAGVYFLIWKANTPYPLQLNWDIYEHISLANKVSTGNLSYFTSQVSDTFTFNSYPPFFHILLALPKILVSNDLLGMYWWLEFFHYAIAGVLIYLFAKKVLYYEWMSVLSAVLSFFIFDSTDAYTTFFLIPQTLATQIAIGGIIYLLCSKKLSKIQLCLIMTCLILMHYIIGLLACVLLLTVYIYQTKRPFPRVFLNSLAACVTVILIGIAALSVFRSWSLTGREEATHFIYSFQEKLGYLLDWYGFGLPIFLVIGIATFIKKKVQLHTAIIICTIGLSILVFLPLSYVLKFFVLDRVFIDLLVGLGASMCLWYLPKKARLFALIPLLMSAILVFYVNQATYKQPLFYAGNYSHITYGEIDAANWLAAHAKAGSLLISDPGTQYILEAVSGVNTQGGVYMTAASREALTAINGNFSESTIKAKLAKIKDQIPAENSRKTDTLLVLSGRYFVWQGLPKEQQLSTFYNVWKPQDLNLLDREYIDFLLKNNPDMKAVYRNSELVIIKL